jgi:hypothetical protein
MEGEISFIYNLVHVTSQVILGIKKHGMDEWKYTFVETTSTSRSA